MERAALSVCVILFIVKKDDDDIIFANLLPFSALYPQVAIFVVMMMIGNSQKIMDITKSKKFTNS